MPAGWSHMKDAPRNGEIILVLHRSHGVMEAYFDKGHWTKDTPILPATYSGSVWVLGDDIEQVEVEEYPSDSGADYNYNDGEVLGWLPRSVLPQTA